MSNCSPQFRALLGDVYGCSICPSSYGFTRSPSGSYFKFPPMIGGNGSVKLLLVGINPRLTANNEHLHTALMSSERAFEDLASNKIGGIPYIRRNGQEFHYRFHVRIVERLFGETEPFAGIAAVSELFLCASANAGALPYPGSPCADRFLPRTLEIAKPKVIIAVGSKVMDYFKTKQHTPIESDEIVVREWQGEYPVIAMPHPANWDTSEDEWGAIVELIIPKIRRWLND